MLPLLLIVAAMGLVFAMGWHRTLSLENLVRHRAALDAFIDAHRLAAIATFMAVYITAASLSLPACSMLTVAGGILFGVVAGACSAVVAATTGAVIIFLIAKSAFGGHLIRRAGPALGKLAAGFCAHAFNYLLFLRLVPVFPFWLVNLAAAIVGVRLATFAAATAIGIVPVTFIFAFIGSGLHSALAAEERAYRACLASGSADCRLHFDIMAALTPELLAAFAALGILALIPLIVRRLRADRQAASSAS